MFASCRTSGIAAQFHRALAPIAPTLLFVEQLAKINFILANLHLPISWLVGRVVLTHYLERSRSHNMGTRYAVYLRRLVCMSYKTILSIFPYLSPLCWVGTAESLAPHWKTADDIARFNAHQCSAAFVLAIACQTNVTLCVCDLAFEICAHFLLVSRRSRLPENQLAR